MISVRVAEGADSFDQENVPVVHIPILELPFGHFGFAGTNPRIKKDELGIGCHYTGQILTLRHSVAFGTE